MKKGFLKISLITATILSLSLLGGCGSKSNDGGAKEKESEIPSKDILWSYETNAQINSSPVVYKNMVIFGNALQKIIALDTQTQKEVWNISLDGVVSNTPILDGDTLIFSTYNTCYGVNPKTGEEIWKYKSDGGKTEPLLAGYDYHSPSPVLYKDTVVFPTVSGKIFGLDKATGKLKWEHKEAGTADLRATPTILNDNLYVADIKGNVYGMNLNTQESVWKTVNGSDIAYSITSHNDLVYISGRNTKVSALDAKTGKSEWTYTDKSGSWLTGEMFIQNDVLYVPGSDNLIVLAFNPKSGSILNNYTTDGNVFSKPLIIDDTMYITSGRVYSNNSGGLVAHKINDDDINPTWKAEIKIPSFSSPAFSDGVIYFGGTDGKLYAVKAN